MPIKLDDLFYTLKINDEGVAQVLNKVKAQLKEMNNEIIDINGIIDQDKLAKPFSMQALSLEQAVSQARLLEQAYKKIEFPHLNQEAELMRQRWQEIQAQLAQYHVFIKSSAMEQATTSQILENEKRLRSDIISIVEKSGTLQTGTAKQIIEEQLALSQLKNERARLSEAEKQGLVSTENLVSAKARITEQEKQHKSAIQQLELQLSNEVKMNKTAEGSMNQLALKLAKLRQEYRALSQAARDGSVGKGMLKEITDLDAQLKNLDSGIGNYQRNIGNYASGFNGLQNAVNQIGRELPSLKMGFGMFMLAISNNLPILSDELERARARYKALVAEGQKATPVWRQVVSALVSWQTVMVVGITLLTVFGKEISNWVVGLFKAKDSIKGVLDMQEMINSEMSKSSGFGDQMTKLRDLQAQWDALGNKLDEKKKFIDENKSSFEELGISVTNVGDAENALVTNTSSVIESLKLRAQATAAYKLASEQYEKQLIKEREAEIESAKQPSAIDRAAMNLQNVGKGSYTTMYTQKSAEEFQQDRVRLIMKEAEEAGKAGDAYFKLGEAALSAAGRIKNITKPKKEITQREISLHDELRNLQDVQNTIRQVEINLIQDGSEKTLAQLKFNHDKKMQQLERQKEDELKKIVQIEKQKFEADPANKGKKFDSSGVSLSPEQTAAYDGVGEVYNKEYQSQINKHYSDVLAKYKTYQEARLEILKKYQADRDVLISQGASEDKVNELERQQEDALQKIDENFGQRSDEFKYWANSIVSMSLEQLVDMLGQVQSKLAIARMNAGKDGEMGDDNTVAMYRAQVIQLQAEIEKLAGKQEKMTNRGYNDWRKLESVLSRVSKEFQNIGKEIGGTVGEIISSAGLIASSTTSMIGGITTLTKWSAYSAEEAAKGASRAMIQVQKASVILTTVSAALKIVSLFSNALSALKDGERDRMEYLKTLTSLQDQYNISLIETKLLHEEVFGGNALGGMFNAMDALNEALRIYNETLNETQKAWKDPDSKFYDKLYKYGTIMGWAGDSTVNSDTGTASLRQNLRYITKKSSKGFLGIGGNHTKTQNLEDWVRENFGEELFLEGGRLNLDLALNLVENSSDRLAGETKDSLERLIEFEQKAQEAEKAMRDYISGTFGELGDAISESIVNAFRNGEDAALSFKDNVGDVLEAIGQQIVRNFFLQKALTDLEKDLYPIYKQFGEDQNVDAFSNNIVGILDTFLTNTEKGLDASNAFLKALQEKAAERGIDIFKPDEESSGKGKGQLESGYANASQESFSALTGATLSTQGIMSDIRNIMYTMNPGITAQTNELKQHTMLLSSMNRYSQEIRDFNANLPAIVEILEKTYRNGTPIRD